MARPKKTQELKHKHQIMLRLTDAEYDIVSTNAKSANLPLAEYARKQLMGKKVIIKYELVADFPELKKLIAAFGKIGSNLNQIARHFNSGGIYSLEIRKSLGQGLSDIYEMKYIIQKLAGNFTGSSETLQNISGGPLHGNTKTHSK